MLADSFWEAFFEIPQLPIFMGCLIPIVAIAGGYWYHVQKVKSNNALKHKLVERGLSVEEIERIMAAGGGHDDEP